jgi:hypothetical protein
MHGALLYFPMHLYGVMLNNLAQGQPEITDKNIYHFAVAITGSILCRFIGDPESVRGFSQSL